MGSYRFGMGNKMVKIVLDLDDKLNEQLRLYINRKYPLKTYGKLKEVVEQALKEFLEKASE
jgi:hypothetical protein